MAHHLKNGFTLIELLLSIFVSSIILTVSVTFLGYLLEMQGKNQTIARVEQTGAHMISHITQKLRNAKSVTTPLPGESAESLSLAFADGAQDPTIYTVASSTLNVAEGGSESLGLSSTRIIVSDFSVSNFSLPNTGGSIQIQFTLSHINKSGRPEYAYEKTFTASSSLRR